MIVVLLLRFNTPQEQQIASRVQRHLARILPGGELEEEELAGDEDPEENGFAFRVLRIQYSVASQTPAGEAKRRLMHYLNNEYTRHRLPTIDEPQIECYPLE